MKIKRIIIIVSIILGILAILAGIYFAWKKTRTILTPPPTTPPVSVESGALESISPGIGEFVTPTEEQLAAQKLKILSEQATFSYWIFSESATSTEVFYLAQDGKIFRVKENGENETIVSDPIKKLQAVKVSSDGKRIIIESGDLNSPQFIIFNSEEKIFETLPLNIVAADFSPDAKKIAYLEKSGGNSAISNLMIKDLEGSKPKTEKLTAISQKDFNLEWAAADRIVLVSKPSAFYSGAAWSVDVKKKTLSPLGSEENGLMFNWSADGKIGLKFSSQRDGREASLNLINESGVEQAVLDFVTLPDKCFVSEPKIYCAIPQTVPAKIVLPDDYLKRAVYFKDSVYQIDVAQNSAETILDGNELVADAFNLTLIGNNLFFINRYDGRLYSLEL